MQVPGKTGPGQGLRSEIGRLRLLPACGARACFVAGSSSRVGRRLPAPQPAGAGGATSFTSCLVEEMVQNKGPQQTQKLPPLTMTIMLRSEH